MCNTAADIQFVLASGNNRISKRTQSDLRQPLKLTFENGFVFETTVTTSLLPITYYSTNLQSHENIKNLVHGRDSRKTFAFRKENIKKHKQSLSEVLKPKQHICIIEK